VVFTGNQCEIPVISNTNTIRVGVFAGDLRTTTAAWIPARKSILCGSGSPADPPEDVYNQIMEKLNQGGGGISTELKERLRSLEERTSNTENEIGELQDAGGNVQQAVGAMQGVAAGALDAISGVQRNVSQLGGTVEGVQQDVGELQTTVGGIQDAVGEMQGVVTSALKALGSVQQDIGKLQQAVAPATSIDLSSFESTGRIVQTNKDGSTVTYSFGFDAAGNPTEITDSNGNKTTLTW
jgi:YD repeat-containing protein